MIKKIFQDTMLSGIGKYAKLNETDESNIQIQIKDVGNEELQYTIAVGWQPTQTVTFLELLDKKFDMMSREVIATPFVKGSIGSYAEECSVPVSEISVFMYKHVVDGKPSVAIAVYNGTTNIKNLTISKYLSELGMD